MAGITPDEIERVWAKALVALSDDEPDRPALLNLKQCCADVRAFEIRILASSIEKQLVLDAFMQI